MRSHCSIYTAWLVKVLLGTAVFPNAHLNDAARAAKREPLAMRALDSIPQDESIDKLLARSKNTEDKRVLDVRVWSRNGDQNVAARW